MKISLSLTTISPEHTLSPNEINLAPITSFGFVDNTLPSAAVVDDIDSMASLFRNCIPMGFANSTALAAEPMINADD